MNETGSSENTNPAPLPPLYTGPTQPTKPEANSAAPRLGRRRTRVIPCLVVLATMAAVVVLWLWYPAQPLVTITPPEDAVPWQWPDSQTLATQGETGNELALAFRLWNARTGKELPAPFPESDKCTYGFVWPGGKLIADRRYDRDRHRTTLNLWDAVTGEKWSTCEGSGVWFPWSLAPRRLSAISTDSGGEPRVRVWDVFTREDVAVLKASRVLTLSPDEKTVVTDNLPWGNVVSPKQELMFWDLERRTERFRIRIPDGFTVVMQFAPHGRTFVVYGSANNASFFKLYDATTCQVRADLGVQPYRMGYGLDGQVLATTFNSRTQGCWVNFWDTDTGILRSSRHLKASEGEYAWISLTSTPASRTVAVESVYEAAPKRPIPWLPRWRWLSALWDREQRQYRDIHLIDIASGETLATLPGAKHERYFLSPDGKLLALKRQDGTAIEIWEIPPRRPVGTLLLLSAVLLAPAALIFWRQSRMPKTAAPPIAEKNPE